MGRERNGDREIAEGFNTAIMVHTVSSPHPFISQTCTSEMVQIEGDPL